MKPDSVKRTQKYSSLVPAQIHREKLFFFFISSFFFYDLNLSNSVQTFIFRKKKKKSYIL